VTATAFGVFVSDEQRGRKQPTYSNTSKMLLLGAAATVLALINMSAGSEARSMPVRILEYIFLACGLIGLIGGLIMMMTQRK
jgi:hypothetical protein